MVSVEVRVRPLRRISRRFRDMVDYCNLLVQFSMSTGMPVFNALVRGEPLNSGFQKFGL